MLSGIFSTIFKYKYIWIAGLILIAYLLPYYILGEDTHIRVHDNMDSNIVWYKVLAESGQIFTLTDSTLPYAIDGLPRSALPTPFDAVVWLYVLFEPMTAYTISQTIMRFGAFIGMYLLLKRHVFAGGPGRGFQEKDERLEDSLLSGESRLEREKYGLSGYVPDWIPAGAALTFAMLPYWPSGVWSIAGIPLALHFFLTIRKYGWATPKYNWVILLLIPFFSNFILSFVFFVALMGLLWLIDWIRSQRINWPFFTAIASMTGIYLVKNYLIISSMFFDSGFTSHREELDLGHNTLERSVELSWENFLYGHTHDEAQQVWIIIPAIFIALVVAVCKNVNPQKLIYLFVANFVISVWYAFWYWEGWRVVKDNFMIANTFNFSRIHFLDPAIWYILFALALMLIWRHMKFGKLLAAVLLLTQSWILFDLNEESKYGRLDTPTFAEFYSEDLFQQIEEYIGEDQSDYQVGSIGMHPTIAQFNGFHTLDTYNNSFPLEYKHAFREVIEGELEKNPTLESYYDTWGGRLYMYVASHGKDYMFTKDREEEGAIENLDIDTEALRDLGGDYILSAVPIENAEELGMELEETFENGESPWKIRLYGL
ncbi:DUF6044 family protein [Lentibacillus sediminis]|uniref:DUF6044 family protein n=1 Tax=Lentibacillus sediminis TaxID=1940529 RepID=UPI000C1C3308